jgi:hypothetical protein
MLRIGHNERINRIPEAGGGALVAANVREKVNDFKLDRQKDPK